MGMIYRIAASNSTAADQQKADVVCTGSHDERIINEYIAKLVNGGTLQFLDGDYFIDAFEHEGNSAIFFGFNEGNARVITLKGDTENKTYNTHHGASLHVTQKALDSLPKGETGRVFYGTGDKPDAPPDFFTYTFVNNVNFENFYLFLYNASYPVIGIDCSHFGSSEIRLIGIFTERYFEDRFLHLKPATPGKGCIGIRTCIHSNDEMARIGMNTVDIGGLYIGFDFVGVDHMILRDCTAARCCYGYVFDQMAKTLTIINSCDEGNTHLPRFHGHGQLTAIDFNIERFNADFIPDDPDGYTEPYAEEDIPGAWHGFLSYTMQGKAFDLRRFWKNGHGINFHTTNLMHERGKRPEYPEYLEMYFDPATCRTLTWTGEKWVDAMGNPVD